MELILGYFIIPILFVLSLLAFLTNFLWKKKKWRILKHIRIYGIIFIVLSILLYFISIPEAFENLELGNLNFMNYLKNFFNVFYYFLSWVLLPFWIFPLFLFSLIIVLIIIGIKKIYNR